MEPPLASRDTNHGICLQIRQIQSQALQKLALSRGSD
jgi:hypothetical protein